ncbi:hypothetical protein ABPG74_021887 [Tetrahymena malaccensis]
MLQGFKKQISTVKQLTITSGLSQTELQKYLFDQRNILHLKIKLALDQKEKSNASTYAKTMAKCLKSLSNLLSLSLIIGRMNQIDDVGYQRIGEGLKSFQKITSFSFSVENDNLLNSESLMHICYGIQTMTNLTSLSINIQVNMIYIQGAQHLGNCLKKLINLNNLTIQILDGNVISSSGAEALAEGIQSLVNLEKLQICLQTNYIGIVGAQSLGQAIKNLKKLQYLFFKLPGENQIEEEGAIGLSQGLKKLEELRNLSLQIGYNNQIKTEGFLKICKSFESMENLQFLNLIIAKKNQISQDGAIQLGKSLKQLYTSLQSLQLTLKEVHIGFEGMEGLMEGLKYLKQLNKFSFAAHDCKITNNGFQKFFTELTHINQISNFSIELEEDQINDEDIQILCEQLKNFKTLKSFMMKFPINNDVSLECKYRLVKSIKSLQYVRQLDLKLYNQSFNDDELNNLFFQLIRRDIRRSKRLVNYSFKLF